MTEDQKPKSLTDVIADFLPLIDELLSAQEVKVTLRPIRAAIMFVDDVVISISGDEKGKSTDYVAKPWFAVIYHYVEKWYQEQYGAAFKRDESGIAIGTAFVRDLPIELRVPLTRMRVETPNETSWLCFPIEVETDENPLDWLVSPPNLERLESNEKSDLIAQATAVATELRALQLNLMGMEPSDSEVRGLLDGVLAEFESCAQNILRNDTSGRGSALWSLQMATERILKAFAKHKNGSFKEIHNLFILYDDVAVHLSGIKRDLLKKLPRDKQAITDRYGLGGTPTLSELKDAYRSALELSAAISRLFKRKISLGGSRFLLKRPPWLTLPPTQKTGSSEVPLNDTGTSSSEDAPKSP